MAIVDAKGPKKREVMFHWAAFQAFSREDRTPTRQWRSGSFRGPGPQNRPLPELTMFLGQWEEFVKRGHVLFPIQIMFQEVKLERNLALPCNVFPHQMLFSIFMTQCPCQATQI
jgi:hypothetical protein